MICAHTLPVTLNRNRKPDMARRASRGLGLPTRGAAQRELFPHRVLHTTKGTQGVPSLNSPPTGLQVLRPRQANMRVTAERPSHAKLYSIHHGGHTDVPRIPAKMMLPHISSTCRRQAAPQTSPHTLIDHTCTAQQSPALIGAAAAN